MRVLIATEWDARLLATHDITPAHAHAVVVTWEGGLNVDGGVPNPLAAPLANALASMGEVHWRLSGDVPSGARLIGRLRSGWSPFALAWNVVGSRDPETVLSLFDAGWAEGDQTALVGAPTDARARLILGRKQLCDLALENGEIVFSAIVDGAGMLIAAGDAAWLERALASVEQQCRHAGIGLRR